MKHLLLALTLLAAGAVSAGKLGVVEMDILLRLHPNTVADEALMKEMVERLEAEQEKGKAQLKELNAAFEKAVEAYENPSLSDKQRAKAKADAQTRQRALIEADNEFRQKRAQRQRELAETESTMVKRTTDKLREIITAYAKDNGYDMIFAANVLPYYSSTVDVTDAILVKMGIDPAKRKELAKKLNAKADARKEK
ncbi:MAG: OmpH family outer membrane protein [Kiritimatiellia bacterium]